MNASYKIVLLAAFVLFAAVVGYYILDGSGDESPADDPTPGQLADADAAATDPADDNPAEPRRTPPGRPVLDRTPEDRTPEPDPVDAPPVVTIDTPPTNGPDAQPPRLGPGAGALAGAGPGASDPATGRPGPGTSASPVGTPAETTDTPGSTAEQPTDTPTPDPVVTEGPTEGTPTPPVETPQPERVTERPTPREPATTNAPRTYTVKPGDTFASIAIAAYGEERYWFEIAQANPSVDPKRLQVDQVIVLPDLSDADRERDEPTPPAPGQDQRYTVKPGDVLSRIAERFYGDSEAWDLIYNRNRDKIGPNPDRLQAGMVLIIPQAYDGAE